MAVSKRTRFEVLRRDEYRCQYCGLHATATEKGLTIDHVLPVTLGGSDKPDNLVTACRDCNAGKTSIAPDAPLVAGLGDRAAAYALGMLEKMARFRASIEEADDYCSEFEDAWNSWTITSTGETVPLPGDYEATLHRWYRMGVPIRAVELAVKSAMALQFPRGEHGRFKYLCGVVWNQINDEGIDYSLTEETARIYTQHELDEHGVEAYETAYRTAWDAGYTRALAESLRIESGRDVVRHHIDGTTTPLLDEWATVNHAA